MTIPEIQALAEQLQAEASYVLDDGGKCHPNLYMHARELAEAVLIDRLPTNLAMARWAAERWLEEVANRPMENIHRKTLDETWKQVIRRCGFDPEVAIHAFVTDPEPFH